MLKVVGASWFQTTVSFSILIGILIFGIVIVIICKWQAFEDDGKYAGTVFWDPDTNRYNINLWGQNNDPGEISHGVARAYYQSSMHETGWEILEIDTNAKYTDEIQAFAAGILEGTLSWQHIYWQWSNMIEQPCIYRKEFCSELREFLENNTAIIRKKAAKKDKISPFWHQVNLFYVQLEGLEFGWQYEMKRNRKRYRIPKIDFVWMNIMSDFKDVENIISSFQKSNRHSPADMSLLKLSKNNGTFFLAHASSGYYSSMLRIQKKYKFNYHLTGGSNTKLVPCRLISFTSYPASIHSQDDFYQIILSDTSKINIAGTALNVEIGKNKNDIKELVFLGPRVMAANRLAKNGSQWAKLIQKHNSGTGNKQWLYVLSKGNNVRLWVSEQISQNVISKEETEQLYHQGYWISCGLPYYKENTSTPEVENNMTQYYNYSIIEDIRQILILGQENVTDIQSLINLMRSPHLSFVGRTDLRFRHEYPEIFRFSFPKSNATFTRNTEIDEYVSDNSSNNSSIKTPSKFIYYAPNPKNRIVTQSELWHRAFRLKNVLSWVRQTNIKNKQSLMSTNLMRTNTKKKIRSKEQSLLFINGIIDLKVTKDENGFLAAAGPPFNLNDKSRTIEPFQWSKSIINYLPHDGHSDIWNYEPVAANFAWN